MVDIDGAVGGVYWVGGGIPAGLLITVLNPTAGTLATPTGGIPDATVLANDGTATPTGGCRQNLVVRCNTSVFSTKTYTHNLLDSKNGYRLF